MIAARPLPLSRRRLGELLLLLLLLLSLCNSSPSLQAHTINDVCLNGEQRQQVGNAKEQWQACSLCRCSLSLLSVASACLAAFLCRD